MEIKSVGEMGYFSGYASMFNYVDNQRDVVMNGSFSRTLAEKGDEVKLLWQHDPHEPIGYFTNIIEDEHGLFVEGYVQQEVARGREAYALLKSGAVRGLSIGYNVKDYSVDNKTGVRSIHDLDLHEISLVTFPANDMAKIISVKSAVGAEYEQFIDEALNDAGTDLKLLHEFTLMNFKNHCEEFKRGRNGFDPSQPRVPSGSSSGGQWTSSGALVAANDNYPQEGAKRPRTEAIIRPDPEPRNWDEIDPPLSDFDMESLVASIFSAITSIRGLRTLLNFVAQYIAKAEAGEFREVDASKMQIKEFEEAIIRDPNGNQTKHGVLRVGQREVSNKEIKQAMSSAIKSGQVTTKIGKYNTLQKVYKGSNGLTVVMETEGRNAGKVITLWYH